MAQQPPLPPRHDEGMGCLWKGCLVLLVLGCLFLGLMAWGAYTLYQEVYQATAPKAVELASASTTEQRYRAVRMKIDSFSQAVEQGKAATLRLNGQDINAFFEYDPELVIFKNNIDVDISGGEISTKMSLPLNDIPGFRDRYFNAKVIMEVKMENGVFTILPSEIEYADGRKASPQFLSSFRTMNWAEQINDPQLKRTLNKVDSIQVEGNDLVIEMKAPDSSAQGASE